MEKNKMTTGQKLLIGGAAAIVVVIGGKAIYEALPSTKEKHKKEYDLLKKEKQEWIDKCTKENTEIDNELKSLKTFSEGELIGRISESTDLSSSLKCKLVSTIKSGRNEKTDDINKAIYKIAKNKMIDTYDTIEMISDIVDTHPKSDSEIICDTVTNLGNNAMKLLAENNSTKKK